jgi:hypothetical protein
MSPWAKLPPPATWWAGAGAAALAAAASAAALAFASTLAFSSPGARPLPMLRWDESSDSTRSIGKLLAIVEQAAETIVGGQLELVVHLDGFERANFNADLAAHANGNIDIEAGGIKLLLAHIIRLLVFAFVDVNALGRALFFADLASHATQAGLPVVAPSYTRKGNTRAASTVGIRSSGYSTVVSRSLET